MGAFGWLTFPITHGYVTSTNCNDCPHYAVDLGTPFHTPITALWGGKVVTADYAVWNGQPGGGEVFVQMPNGQQYYYYHLDQINVFPGETITQGQVVGLSGGQNSGGSHPVSTMWSSGAHTHVGFFSKFVNNGKGGTIPFGPDITSSLKALSVGSGGIPTIPSAFTLGQTSQPSTPPFTLDTQFFHDLGQKIMLMLTALVLIGAGFYLLFTKQINEGVKKAAKLAVMA